MPDREKRYMKNEIDTDRLSDRNPARHDDAFSGRHSRRNRKRKNNRKILKRLLFLFALLLAVRFLPALLPGDDVQQLKEVQIPDWIDTQLIQTDGASRRGADLKELNNIVVHYVGNPGSTAQQNRDYFDSSASNVSSHFVVGLEGEIIQCLPLWEISSASNHRNSDTISIEVCHPDTTGRFTDAARQSVTRLCAWLCQTGSLDSEDVIRHYDVTGKLCPLYYVEYEEEWIALKNEIQMILDAGI